MVRGKIKIDEELCKACGYCIEHCPKKLISFSRVYNSKGYTPAVYKGDGCTGCGICAIVCPEAIVEVWRE